MDYNILPEKIKERLMDELGVGYILLNTFIDNRHPEWETLLQICKDKIRTGTVVQITTNKVGNWSSYMDCDRGKIVTLDHIFKHEHDVEIKSSQLGANSWSWCLKNGHFRIVKW